MQQSWLAVVFVVGGIVAFVTGVRVWQKQMVPGMVWFVGMMFGIAWWEFGRAFEALAIGIPAKVIWAQVQYLTLPTVPLFWFMFAVAYSSKHALLTRRRLVLLWLVPILATLATWTNALHGLYWSFFTSGPNGPQDNIVYGHGPLFWIVVVYSYLLLVGATILFVRRVLSLHELYRLQAAALLIAVFIPWVANIVYVFGLSPVPGVDPAPIALTLAGLIWIGALYAFRLFDLVPVARDTLVESMSDGVIVLDAHNRVVDVNAAGLRLLGETDGNVIGHSASETFPVLQASKWLEKIEAGLADWEFETPDTRFLHVRVSSLTERRGRVGGHLLIVQDVTARTRAAQELEQANIRLQSQLREIQELQTILREQAVRDPLTGLYNRRFLHEILDQAMARGEREPQPLCIVLIDLDHFKSFNDSYGHEAGDSMLKRLSDWLQVQTRRGDTTCRYGGEEFIVVLPNAGMGIGMRRAKEWCASFRELHLSYENVDLCSTLSIGVACFPQHGTTMEQLIRAADGALYAAKAAGRDCVRSASDNELSQVVPWASHADIETEV